MYRAVQSHTCSFHLLLCVQYTLLLLPQRPHCSSSLGQQPVCIWQVGQPLLQALCCCRQCLEKVQHI